MVKLFLILNKKIDDRKWAQIYFLILFCVQSLYTEWFFMLLTVLISETTEFDLLDYNSQKRFDDLYLLETRFTLSYNCRLSNSKQVTNDY